MRASRQVLDSVQQRWEAAHLLLDWALIWSRKRVEHEQADGDAGSVLHVQGAGQGRVEADGHLRSKRLAVEPGRHDRNRTSAAFEAAEAGLEVPSGRMPVDRAANGARKGRVDQENVGLDVYRQQIVDEFAIVIADPRLWKGQFEAVSATGIDLVQHEGGPELRRGPDEQSGAGGGFEHGVGRAELCRHAHNPGDRGRRGELLECELVFGAHRLRRQPPAQIDQSFQRGRRDGDVHARTG